MKIKVVSTVLCLMSASFGCSPELKTEGETLKGGVSAARSGADVDYRIRLVRPHADDPSFPDLSQVVVDSENLAGRVAESMIFMGAKGEFLNATGGRLFLTLSGPGLPQAAQVKWRLESGGPGTRATATTTELSGWTDPQISGDESFLYFELNPQAWSEKRLVFPGDRLVADLKLGHQGEDLRTLVFYDAGSSPVLQVFALDRKDEGALYRELLTEKGYLVGEEKFQNPTEGPLQMRVVVSGLKSGALFSVRARQMPIFRWNLKKKKWDITPVDGPVERVYESDLKLSGVEFGGKSGGEGPAWAAASEDGTVSFSLKAGEEVLIRYYVKPTRTCAELKRLKAPSPIITLRAVDYPKNIYPGIFSPPAFIVREKHWAKMWGGSDLTRVTETRLVGKLVRSVWLSDVEDPVLRAYAPQAPGQVWTVGLNGKETKRTASESKRLSSDSCRGIPVMP